MSEDDIRRVVMGVPEVKGCHQIRTRGSADYTFLDLHVWFHGDTTLCTRRTACRTWSRIG